MSDNRWFDDAAVKALAALIKHPRCGCGDPKCRDDKRDAHELLTALTPHVQAVVEKAVERMDSVRFDVTEQRVQQARAEALEQERADVVAYLERASEEALRKRKGLSPVEGHVYSAHNFILGIAASDIRKGRHRALAAQKEARHG